MIATLGSSRRAHAAWLVAGIWVAVVILGWSVFRATRAWSDTSELLVQRRAEQTADLLARALQRDMRGAEALILKRLHWDQLTLDQPYEVTNVVASAFARYPYLESFFGVTGQDPQTIVFFTRTDRRPPWLTAGDAVERFPVTVAHEIAEGDALLELVRTSAVQGLPLATSEPVLGGQRYQAVARLMYRTGRRDRFEGAFGFLVNLAWVKEHYFPELLAQVAPIVGAGNELRMTISDENGKIVAGATKSSRDGLIVSRPVHRLFFDPTFVSLASQDLRTSSQWTVEVSATDDSTLALAYQGANRTIWITVGAAATLGIGLLLTTRAVRASADLAEVRSDFVSSVTHELKTPLTTIRTVAEAFMLGRLSDGQEIREYSQILDQEAKRLIRLVDNLLAYSRVTDVSEVYTFEALAPGDLIDDVLRRFHAQFVHQGFEHSVELAPDLPSIRGDRTALTLALDNLVDNALRYSGERRWLSIKAWPESRMVHLEVTDRGVGIPADEIEQVTLRFVRGRQMRSSGSGLGLAIVTRVVADHGGRLSITSEVDRGTRVTVTLPVPRERRHETADPDRRG